MATIERPAPPHAERRPHVHTLHDDERLDPYHWLKDPSRSDPAVLAHLEAENAYTDALLAHTADAQQRLFEEMRARIPDRDWTVPLRDGHWLYFGRIERDQQYWNYLRKRGDDAPEEVLLDANALAEGHPYFAVGPADHSPDNSLFAYGVDTEGGEHFRVRIKDMATGELLPDEIEGAAYEMCWTLDGRSLFYVTRDDAMRDNRVWLHRLGDEQGDDTLLFQEDDDAFYVGIARSRSRRFLFVGAGSLVTNEWHALDLTDPEGKLHLVEARRHGVEYDVEDLGDRFVIRTNADAEDFRVVEAPYDAPGRGSWRDLVPHRPGITVEDILPFRDWLVVQERAEGLRRVLVIARSSGEQHHVEFDEPVFVATPIDHWEFDTDVLRFTYESPTTPEQTIDYDMRARSRTLRKQHEVPGYDPAAYVTERLWAPAADGASVPLSVVRRADLPRDGSAPCWLYGYGSYGSSIEPWFNSARVSLLDRGFVVAIAHIRGGGELGEGWRNAGKLARKTNTFGDFVASAEHLVVKGYTRAGRLVANGASAGGLLMGAVTNMRPDLFGIVVADVPFVDVLSTILDTTLMFSALEFDEWGDPNDTEQYGWIRAYSPYDNVTPQAYPAVLATTGLHDPRVNYWEPAKWVARLRDATTGDQPILLKTYMTEGHGGASGRYDRLRQVAFAYAFAFDRLDIDA